MKGRNCGGELPAGEIGTGSKIICGCKKGGDAMKETREIRNSDYEFRLCKHGIHRKP